MAAKKMVTNEQILTEIMQIHLRIEEIQLAEAARIEREKVTDDMVHSHDRAINGNGKPGLKSDVQTNRSDIQIVRDQVGRINWIGAIITAAIIADIVSRVYK